LLEYLDLVAAIPPKESMKSAALHVFSYNNMKLGVKLDKYVLCSLVEFLKIVLIMLVLCLMLAIVCYAYYYANIIGQSL